MQQAASAQSGMTCWAKIPSATNSGEPARSSVCQPHAGICGDVGARHLGPALAAELLQGASRASSSSQDAGPSQSTRPAFAPSVISGQRRSPALL